MPASTPVSLESHAAESLRYIRASMEAAGTVAVPGSAPLAMGAAGVCACAAALYFPERWLTVWLAAAALAAPAGMVLMARQAALRRFTLFGAPVRKLILCLAPALFAAAVLTVVLVHATATGAIPGTWLLLYGCALIAASAPTTRAVAVLGAVFTGLGLVTYVLPHTAQMLALGGGFGAAHIIFGLLTLGKSHAAA